MLTSDALIQAAKERGMPEGKMRGILREYLQVLILKELYRLEAGKKFCFTGGTYLRLVHQTKRFSEDLDFNAKGLTKAEFENTLNKMRVALKKSGMDVRLGFGHWQNLWVAELIFPDIERVYGVVSQYSKKEGIVIKAEVMRPRWKIEPEAFVIQGFGEMYPAVCTQRGALFADKIDALLKKNRARHLFDLLFMLGAKYPIDAKVLKAVGVKEAPLEAVVRRVEQFPSADLKSLAESLRPFLFDEQEAGLIVNAKTIIRQLVEQYQRI